MTPRVGPMLALAVVFWLGVALFVSIALSGPPHRDGPIPERTETRNPVEVLKTLDCMILHICEAGQRP